MKLGCSREGFSKISLLWWEFKIVVLSLLNEKKKLSFLQIEKKYFEKIISFPKIHINISFSFSLEKHTQS